MVPVKQRKAEEPWRGLFRPRGSQRTATWEEEPWAVCSRSAVSAPGDTLNGHVTKTGQFLMLVLLVS